MIRSTASRKSCLSTAFLSFLAAINAASLQTFAISAPENPGVCFERKSVSKSFAFSMVLNEHQKFLFALLYRVSLHKSDDQNALHALVPCQEHQPYW